MAHRIGLLTGTFDPVHAGHVELARAARRQGGLDEVWLLVNPRPWHKNGAMSYRDRVAMAELAVRAEPLVSVYTGTYHGYPHTIRTFERVMREHPEHTFEFLVGEDTLNNLDRWDDIESVVGTTSFVMGRRPGAGSIDDLRVRLGDLGDRLIVRTLEVGERGAVSSTGVRARLRAGERPEGLDSRVYRYIVSHELYS